MSWKQPKYQSIEDLKTMSGTPVLVSNHEDPKPMPHLSQVRFFSRFSESKLRERLEGLQTRKNEKTFAFWVTRKKEQTLLSERDFHLNFSNNKGEVVLEPSELAEFILKEAEEENQYEEANSKQKSKDFRVIYASLMDLVFEISKQIDHLKEKTALLFKKNKSGKFTELLHSLDQSSFGENLEVLLSSLAENGLKKTDWKAETGQSLMESIEEMESKIKRETEKCRGAVSSRLGVTQEFKEFEKNLKEEVFSAGFDSQFCFGNRGIIAKPPKANENIEELLRKLKGERGKDGEYNEETQEVFGTLSMKGNIKFTETNKGRLCKEAKVPVNSHGNYNSLDFSPNGLMFLVGVRNDRKIFVFDSESLEQKQVWEDKKAVWFNRAKWIDDQHILGCFGYPGELKVFALGSQLPIRTLSPNETSPTWIVDFDFGLERNKVICGTGTGQVLQLGIGEGQKGAYWKHKGHGSWVTGVKVSQNKQYVLTSGEDKAVVLALEADGRVLSNFKKFTAFVHGISWAADNETILVCSLHEVVLLKRRKNNQDYLEQLAQMKKAEFDDSNINAMASSFELGQDHKGKSYFLLGLENGRVFKVPLK